MDPCVGTQIREEHAIHSTDFAPQMGEAMGHAFCANAPVSRTAGQDTRLLVCSGYTSWSGRLEDILSNECLMR